MKGSFAVFYTCVRTDTELEKYQHLILFNDNKWDSGKAFQSWKEKIYNMMDTSENIISGISNQYTNKSLLKGLFGVK